MGRLGKGHQLFGEQHRFSRMSFLDNLFGRKKPQPTQAASPTLRPATLPPKQVPADPSNDPNMIRVYDAYGREMFIPKQEWRTKVLPGTIKTNWNNPDQLYGVIFVALNDGFFADVLDAAKQLQRIDPDPTRAACVYGIVLMKNDRLNEAERVFRLHLEKHGEDGSILTNLAKVYSARNDHQKADEILWHALEVDPNQDNGMGWYFAIQREPDGEQAAWEALRRVAAIPGSWRAQLWLARLALENHKPEEAQAVYQDVLARVTKPVPTDLLMQMSGDLGNAGHLPEILQLVEPYFDAPAHGLTVGNNLIKAHLDLGHLDAARRILDQLYALKRMDWQQHLSFWDTEIAKARVGTTQVDQKASMKVAMLTGEGTVWLKRLSPAAELFPAKSSDALVIAFLGSSAEMATNSKRIEQQLANTQGRLSRSIPLFLAEQVEFNSSARTQSLVPWITEPSGGFVLSGGAWKDEDAANYSLQGQIKCDYIITCHLKTQAEPWILELRLVRSIDGKCLGNLCGSFPSAEPQQAIPGIARQLLTLLAQQAEVEIQAPPPSYQVPAGANFPYYLLRLEQLLAVRCGGIDGVQAGFLNGEREIIDGNIQQCLACPDNVGTRILLAETLKAMKNVRPDILPEFKDKIESLQKEKPLAEPAHSVVQRIINDVLTA
jgi:Tetratricopeptide repeat.